MVRLHDSPCCKAIPQLLLIILKSLLKEVKARSFNWVLVVLALLTLTTIWLVLFITVYSNEPLVVKMRPGAAALAISAMLKRNCSPSKIY